MYKFEFTEAELNIILKGLGELPSKESFMMISKIHQEVSIVKEQQIAEEAKEKKATEKVDKEVKPKK